MWTHPHPFQDGSHIFPEKRGLNVAELLHLQSYGISFLPQEFYSARHILENESPFSRYRTRCLLGHDSAMEKYFSSLAEGRRQSPSSSSPCSSSSALGPLKAFCATKQVQRLVSANLCGKSKESEQNNANIPNNPTQTKSLKFGIHRILSEDFGKSDEESIERNTKNRRKSPSPDHRVSYVDPCGCGVCKYNLQSRFFPSPSLSAVHALQPPSYPLPQSIDSLPGPYAVLNDDGSCSGQSKRKRSWSRAVFSNLQRKGLEKRFEVQKYVTKPDRRQLAAMLGLTDAQVKVWFQNRRMKWRHAQQQLQAESGDSSDRSETKSVVENNTPMEMKDGLPEQDEHFVDLQETNDDDMDSTCSSPMETEKCHFEFGTGSPHSEEVDNLA